MTPDQIDAVSDAVANLGTVIDLAVLYVAAAAGLGAAAAVGAVTAGYWTGHCIARASRQPGIRRLEAYANHPGVRAATRNQHWKEDRP